MMLKKFWLEALFVALVAATICLAFAVRGSQAPAASFQPFAQLESAPVEEAEFVTVTQAQPLPRGEAAPVPVQPVNLDALADLTVRMNDMDGRLVAMQVKIDKLVAAVAALPQASTPPTQLPPAPVTPPPVAAPPVLLAAGGCGQGVSFAASGCGGSAHAGASADTGRVFDGQGWYFGKVLSKIGSRRRGGAAGGCQ
jgi:hypothetical protein